MRYKWVNGHLIPVLDHEMQEPINPLSCFAESDGDDDSGGGGGGGTDGDKGDGNKGGTQDDFAAKFATFQGEVTNALKAITSEVKALKTTGSPATQSVIEELKASLDAIKSRFQVQDDGDSKKDDGKKDDAKQQDDNPAAQQIATLERQLKKLSTDLESEKAGRKEEADKRTAAEARQRNSERDRLIISAFRNAGGRDDIDDKTILRQYRDDFEFTDDEVWVGEGGKDINAHVKANLPNWMKKPKSGGNGGSGGHTPDQGDKPTIAQLRQKGIELGMKARAEGINSRSSSQFERAKRDYEEAGGNVADIIDAVARS